jgi:hypothetical protein
MANAANFGCVFYDPLFEFQDGTIGRKLFVVLCESPLDKSEIVVVRTTSRAKSDPIYGCHLESRFQNFFLPCVARVFPKDTWVMLDFFSEYDETKLGTRRAERKGKLSTKSYRDLLDCAVSSIDVPIDIRDHIQAHIKNLDD